MSTKFKIGAGSIRGSSTNEKNVDLTYRCEDPELWIDISWEEEWRTWWWRVRFKDDSTSWIWHTDDTIIVRSIDVMCYKLSQRRRMRVRAGKLKSAKLVETKRVPPDRCGD